MDRENNEILEDDLIQQIKDKDKYIDYLEKVIVAQSNTLLLSDKERLEADQTITAYEMLHQLSEDEIRDRDSVIQAHENLMSLSAQELLQKDTILNSILETNQYICTIIEENAILQKTLMNLITSFNFKRGMLLLKKKDGLREEIFINIDKEELSKSYFTFSREKMRDVEEMKEAVIIKNEKIVIDGKDDIISIVCLPLIYQDIFLGIIYIDCIGSTIYISPNEIETAKIFGTQAAISLNSVILYKKLKEQSIVDKLTGLPNRKKLEIDLEAPGPKTFALLNIDGFSSINVAYGVEAGNFVLISIVDRLKAILPPETELYRLSADEFVILSRNMEFTPSLIKTSITNNITNSAIHYQKIHINISFSIGIVYKEEKQLLRKADISLKSARKKGRGYVIVYDESYGDIKQYQEVFFWVNKLKDAVRKDKMLPYYQGIYNNKTGACDLYECLVRINDDGKIISPTKFLEPAKQIGLYSTVSYCMIDKTFNYFQGKDIIFSINLSQEDFTDDKIIDYIEYKLNKHSHKPENIIFEIIEDFSLKNITSSLEFIKKLKTLGVKIAIDDFGSEFSNFSRLLSINADYIKIDGDFIKNIPTDENSFKIARSIS
ncbi:MAG: GGDEF domain-containing protein, partial [Spirochaetales bacterium]|nr:GGDEF domain-containing protein [Spirochaetales bacterium]